MDPLEFGTAAIGAVFGAGVAWASIQNAIKSTRIEAATARQQADEALARLNVEKERSTKQDGKLDLYKERLDNLRRDVDELRAAVFKSRIGSEREIPAVRPIPRPDERREDSDPPPVRGRLPSRRDV